MTLDRGRVSRLSTPSRSWLARSGPTAQNSRRAAPGGVSKNLSPLETIVGTTGGDGAVTGNLLIDPARPQDAKGTIKVDLNALKTGIDRRDTHMRSKDFLDSESNDANRYAIFEVKAAEVAGPLEPGKTTAAKVRGTLTIRGKPVDTWADCTINYVKRFT